MPTPETTHILHLFTSPESAAAPTAQSVLAEQRAASPDDKTTIHPLLLTTENSTEALAAIFAADNITTWPGSAK